MLRRIALLALAALAASPLAAQKPDLFILSVGVEQYRDSRLNLNYCADDARDLAAAIGRQNLLYTIHTPRVLTDAQASRAAIRTALSELEREVTTDDLLIFIFSGHGIEERLVTYDFNVADKTASSLGKDDLFELINKLGCGYLLFIDACHSGSFAKSGPKNITEAAAGLHSRALVEALAGTDKPYLIFGSSGSDQKSWECQSCGHGYFAQTVLDALQNKTVTSGARSFTPDGNGDGFISVYELDNYIKEAVRVQTAREESPQKVYSRLTMGANFPLFSLPGARLNPPPPSPVSTSGTQSSGTSAQTTPPPNPGADERRRDLEAYEKAKAAHTIEAYQEYLRLRPNGFFAESARKALNDLVAAQTAQRSAEEDDLDWRMAQTADTETAYRYYLDTWPNGRHRHEAQAALGSEQLFLSENKKRPGVITTSSGLQYEVLKKGNGTGAPKATDKVTVHYHGTLIDGTVFDSSVNRGQTATFGLNQVIPGWTEGLQLMRVGDKFRFYMPANLAYGNRSPSAKIKPNSMLIFDVELFSIGQ